MPSMSGKRATNRYQETGLYGCLHSKAFTTDGSNLTLRGRHVDADTWSSRRQELQYPA